MMSVKLRFICCCFFIIVFLLLSTENSFAETGDDFTIVVLNLAPIGVSDDYSTALSEKLRFETGKLFKKSDSKYNLMKYDEVNKILAEYEIKSTGSFSDSVAVEFGKMLQADRICIGSAGNVNETYFVGARIVDVETGTIIASTGRERKGSINDVPRKLIPKIAKDLYKDMSDYDRNGKRAVDSHGQSYNTLAVIDLEGIGISDRESRVISEKLRYVISDEIQKKKMNYVLVERAQMDKIFDMLEVKGTGDASDSVTVEFGKMLQIDRIVIGSVGRDDNTITINVSIVDVESSNVINKVNRQHKGSIDRFLVSVIPKAGQELLKVY